jgi:hypothetical protein
MAWVASKMVYTLSMDALELAKLKIFRFALFSLEVVTIRTSLVRQSLSSW